jgi:hypothetical protein
MKVKSCVAAALVAISLSGCASDDPNQPGASTTPPTPPSVSTPTAPSSADKNSVAIRFQQQAAKHARFIPKEFGTITTGRAVFDHVEPYGDVLVQSFEDGEGSGLAQAVMSLTVIALATRSMEQPLHDLGCSYVAFEDPARERGYVRVTDLIAHANGTLSLSKLRHRVVFDL